MPNQHTVKKPTGKKASAPARAPQKTATPTQYVTKAEFEDFGNRMVDAIERISRPVLTAPGQVIPPGNITAGATATTLPNPDTGYSGPQGASQLESAEEREVRKAGANDIPMNPEWDEMARDIIGDAVDHCEIKYLQQGGVVFTVVIKKDQSNAPADYLAYYGADRRSKEIGNEGISGVEAWCRLIKSNLARQR